MKRLGLIILSVFFLTHTAFGQTHWKLDRAHSTVHFQAEHIIVMSQVKDESDEEYLTMGVTEGQFQDFEVNFVQTGKKFTDSRINASVRVKSIFTGNSGRDMHLQSEDFFYAEKYPVLTFESKTITKTGENTYQVAGDLTIRGVTHPVTLETKTNGTYVSEDGNTYVSFTATGLINRLDYGLRWSDLMENGAFRVSNYVSLTIQANFVQTEEAFSTK